MLFYAILILASIVFFALSYFKPLWSLFFIAATLPTYLIRFNLGLIPFTWLEAMIWLLLIAVILGQQIDLKKIRQDYFFWPILLLLAVAVIAVFVSPDKLHALGAFKAYFLEPIIYYFLIVSLIKERRQIEGLFWGLGLSVIYLGSLAIFQKFWPIGVPAGFLTSIGSADRVTSVFGYPNAIGLFFGPIIVAFFGFLYYKNPDSLLLYFSNRSRFWFKLAVVVIGFLALFLAKSEGAIIAVVICGFLFLFFNKKTRWYVLSLGLIFGILFIFNSWGLRDLLWAKVCLLDWSGYVRRSMWLETINMLKDNWFWGVGLAGYKLAIIPYHTNVWFETFPYPHNILLNFWSELGLLGLVAFGWIIIKFCWLNFKNFFSIAWCYSQQLPFDKVASLVFILIAIEMAIHGLVDVPYFKNDLSMLFWITLGVTALNVKLKNV